MIVYSVNYFVNTLRYRLLAFLCHQNMHRSYIKSCLLFAPGPGERQNLLLQTRQQPNQSGAALLQNATGRIRKYILLWIKGKWRKERVNQCLSSCMAGESRVFLSLSLCKVAWSVFGRFHVSYHSDSILIEVYGLKISCFWHRMGNQLKVLIFLIVHGCNSVSNTSIWFPS